MRRTNRPHGWVPPNTIRNPTSYWFPASRIYTKPTSASTQTRFTQYKGYRSSHGRKSGSGTHGFRIENDEDFYDPNDFRDQEDEIVDQEGPWWAERKERFWKEVGDALGVVEGERVWGVLKQQIESYGEWETEGEKRQWEGEMDADTSLPADLIASQVHDERAEQVADCNGDGDTDSLHSWVSVGESEESWCEEMEVS